MGSIIYHGEEGWKYRTLQGLFDGLDGELLAYVPDFEYVYHDLRGTPDEDIERVGNRYLMAALLLLKHTFDGLWLQGNFSGLLAIGLPQASGKLQRALLTYYFERVEFTEERINEVIREIPTDIQEVVMSTYELLIEKGRKEERAKADKEQKRLEQELLAKAEAEKLKSALEFKKMGVPVADIAKGLGLTVEQVEKLK